MHRNIKVIAAIVVLVFIAGELLSYTTGTVTVIETRTNGGDISYTVTSAHDYQLSEIHIDNGISTPSEYLLLYDTGYKSVLDANTLESTVYMASKELEKCRSLTVHTASAQKVLEMIENSLETGTYDIGLVIISGAIPDVIYDGTATSKIVQWMNSGGHLTFSAAPFGKYISTIDGIKTVEEYETTCASILGSEGIFRDDNDGKDRESYGYSILEEEITKNTILSYNLVTYGTDISKIPSARFYGYTDGQYASIAIFKVGNGMLTYFGGNTSNQNIWPVIHILGFGLTYASEIISLKGCSITDGKKQGSFSDNGEIDHFVCLSDLRLSRLWHYDRSESRFL